MTDSILKDGERIDQLFSSDVKIIQNKAVFSYSVDSVLLSRFPKIPSRGLIVDLCSGNGAVGLFASHQTKAQIVEVELQERLADMAQRSITLNQLDAQVTMVNDDLKNLLQHVKRFLGGAEPRRIGDGAGMNAQHLRERHRVGKEEPERNGDENP